MHGIIKLFLYLSNGTMKGCERCGLERYPPYASGQRLPCLLSFGLGEPVDSTVALGQECYRTYT